MESKPNASRKINYVLTLMSGIAVVAILNIRSLQYEPIHLWVRIICPLLLILGIIGSLLDARLIRIMGWLGIGIFVVCGLQMILPGDDYMSGGPSGAPLNIPRLVSPYEIAIRATVFIAVVTGLVYGFRRLLLR